MMSKKLLTAIMILGLVAATACGDDSNSDNSAEPFSPECTTFIQPSADAETNVVNIQTALTAPESGAVICLADGTYPLNGQLELNNPDLSNIEIRGQSQDGTILDFGEGDGGNGILITGVDDFRAANFTIKNTAGDGIKVQQGNGVEFVNLTVTWDGGPKQSNGAYGIYPVLEENVLIEGCVVSNASDAGIYVGQSTNVIVRDNEAFGNVAGLELENTSYAEVYNNHLHDNTGGLLIFDLPNLEVDDGSHNKIHDNIIENNNQGNFAPPAAIVAQVPAGTGILLLSTSQNEIYDNTIRGNKSIGVVIASYLSINPEITDEDYFPYSEANYIHDNIFENNGAEPSGLATVLGGPPVAALTISGFFDPNFAADGGTFEDIRTCFKNNVDGAGEPATFHNANLDGGFPSVTSECGDDLLDFCNYDCVGIELPAVTLE
jgi:parallel beta-helix repeat protein